MQETLGPFRDELRNRYAECTWIDLRLRTREGRREVVGEFVPNRDGVMRRHIYRLNAEEVGGTDVPLTAVLARFEDEIRRHTRLERR